MCFELTEALINDILFSMEDQKGEFFVDTLEGMISGDIPENNKERRFRSLPKWDSADGFRLMERFTASFKNPLIRDKLTAALNRGKGVFRAFKDVLGVYPEVEQRWFAFKEREMRRVIFNWYNGLREEWGLERIGGEPDETGDLVLEDFRIREGTTNDSRAAAALHRLCFEEQTDSRSWVFPGILALVAESGAGEFAAYAVADNFPEESALLRITALEVQPEYRGLGIGESLLTGMIERLRERGRAVVIELPVKSEGFSRVLLRESFAPISTCYRLDLALRK
ncbi:MAG: GNAT family N-acetyltransferase [Treponema sp.]|nr:GNAT family N-acetyltransferase [Treponema sp.]